MRQRGRWFDPGQQDRAHDHRVDQDGRSQANAERHSPTNEAAALGLTGEIVEPMSKGSGVLLVVDEEETRVEPLE